MEPLSNKEIHEAHLAWRQTPIDQGLPSQIVEVFTNSKGGVMLIKISVLYITVAFWYRRGKIRFTEIKSYRSDELRRAIIEITPIVRMAGLFRHIDYCYEPAKDFQLVLTDMGWWIPDLETLVQKGDQVT